MQSAEYASLVTPSVCIVLCLNVVAEARARKDPDLDITIGLLMPESNTTTEFVAQIVAPATYGYTGLSMAGTMADSLLFVI